MIMRMCPYDEIQTTEERCFSCNRPTIESRSAAWDVGEYGYAPECGSSAIDRLLAMELLQAYGEDVEQHNRMARYQAQMALTYTTSPSSSPRLIFSTVA